MNIKERLKIESKILITDDLKKKTLRQFNLNPKPKRKRIFIMTPLIGALAAVLILFMIIFMPRSNEGENVLILSINPQILLKYDSNNKIKEVKPLNEDAVILLYDLEVEFEGLNLEEGILEIETKARHLGYQNKVNLTHIGKTKLRLNNYEVNNIKKSYYENMLLEKGYTKKDINVSNEALIKLAFETDEDRLFELETTLSLQTSKINSLINRKVSETQQKGEAVLQTIKDLLEDFKEEEYLELMGVYFKSEPLYTDKTLIYEQLEELKKHYNEYLRYQTIQIKNGFKQEIDNMIGVVKENHYNPNVIDNYEISSNGDVVSYSEYKKYTYEEKVLLNLVDEMTRILKMPKVSRISSERLQRLYLNYLTLKEHPNVRKTVLNLKVVRDFERLYESKKGE
jgi:uncharacterized coiled-coil protein SlyX